MTRTLIFSALFCLTAFAQTESAPDDADFRGNIRAHRFDACDYWQNINTDLGRAYACGFRPQTVVVPDAQDVVRELNAALKQIELLEQRVEALEKKVP